VLSATTSEETIVYDPNYNPAAAPVVTTTVVVHNLDEVETQPEETITIQDDSWMSGLDEK